MTRYDTVRSLVRDQVTKGNREVAEQILVSAYECNILYHGDLNKISTEHGLTGRWYRTV